MVAATTVAQPVRGIAPQKNVFQNYVAIFVTLVLLLRDVDSFAYSPIPSSGIISRSSTTLHRRKTPVYMSTMPIEAWNRFIEKKEKNGVTYGATTQAVLAPPPPTEELVTLPELGPDGVYHIENEAQYR